MLKSTNRYALPPRLGRPRPRIFEIDFLRGFDVILMVLLHFACALKLIAYFMIWNGSGEPPAGMTALLEFGAEVFDLINHGSLFVLEFFFSMLFVFLSGVSSSFSRSNALRGMRLLMVAVAMSLVLDLFSYLTGAGVHIYCGILHALSIAILVYSFVNWLSKGNLYVLFGVAAILVVATIICTFYGNHYPGDETIWGKLAHWIDPDFVYEYRYLNLVNGGTIYHPSNLYPTDRNESWKLLFGLAGFGDDYFSPLQCTAVLFLGAVAGKLFYPNRKGFLKDKKRPWARPIVFLSKHSLLLYVLHMPLVYLVLGGVMLLMGYSLNF